MPGIRELRSLISVLFIYSVATMPYYAARTYVRRRWTRKKQYDEWKSRIDLYRRSEHPS